MKLTCGTKLPFNHRNAFGLFCGSPPPPNIFSGGTVAKEKEIMCFFFYSVDRRLVFVL